ncbi:MAG: lipopolysaccharide assembly protein LapB [Wenzhouxiangella sp.]|nr:MAG: lipopolysaccharide assembly protein LapB [Wenzhouxiangella sp.]
MVELSMLFVLLPAAAVSGWLLGRGQQGRQRKRDTQLSSQYFRGLNYLLNEESDKAIEEFVKLAEVNRDTVDTHLALGTLFRRRGEMDKAIRYHKHIISRPDLGDEQREQVLFELALDYMRAGLLDRAERLFLELTDSQQVGEAARRHLLDIYQQEKDWVEAIEQARALENAGDTDRAQLIAQLHCEIAQQALAADEEETTRQHLRQARRYEPGNARARLIEAELARRSGFLEEAAASYREACELDTDLLVGHHEAIREVHEQTGQRPVLLDWLSRLHEGSGLLAPALLLARLRSEDDARAAADFLLEKLTRRPTVRGLEYLMQLLSSHDVSLDEVGPDLIRDLMQRLMDGQPVYRCRQCGFSGSSHHWLCPSCRSWNTTRVIQGVLGE